MFLGAALLLLAASCTNDNVAQNDDNPEPGTEGLTAFVIEDNNPVNKATTTRTTAQYDGTGLDFFWTSADRLWVNNGTLIPDARNDIESKLVNSTVPGGVQRAAKAKFWFNGTYTANAYPVRYTGKGSTAGDKVTFQAQQSQKVANDASHIGESGDCGVATATKAGARYHFTLDHKASYLTLLPYSTLNFSAFVKVTQIKITADEALSGQFDFNDNGVDLASRPVPTADNRSITLTLNGGGTNGFKIPTAARKEDNASIIVLPPGTYNNVAIEYTLYDQLTKKNAIVKREYASLVFTPGKNKKVSSNLQMQSIITPMGVWDRTTCPNTNETMWYIHRGDPHMDTISVYAARRAANLPANICLGGLWLKKKANIPGFNATTTYNGLDYTGTTPGGFQYSSINYYAFLCPVGKPANTNDYFFLPSVFPYGTDAVQTGSGQLRYWMRTVYSNTGKDSNAGQVFACDIAPVSTKSPEPDIGIGLNYMSRIIAQWTAQ